MLKNILPFIVILLASCSTARRTERNFSKNLKNDIENSKVFQQGFTGFVLADAESGKILCNYNGDKFFTPASNTKTLTLFVCLKILGDSLPGIQFAEVDSLGFVFRGTGDPTFLHPKFQAWQKPIAFLNAQPKQKLVLAEGRMLDERFGEGWSWDDFDQAYSPERAEFPVFGNVASVKKSGEKWSVWPPFFQKSLQNSPAHIVSNEKFARDETSNVFHLNKEKVRVAENLGLNVPISNMKNASRDLLADTLKAPQLKVRGFPGTQLGFNWKTMKSAPVDTVYRRLMHQSDNFIAEQLLLQCAGVKFDTLEQQKIINYALDSLFNFLPRKPRWVDGSGLSRYNLNTPYNNVLILNRLWKEQPRERLFSIFPAGGRDGTLTNWFGSPDGRPYLFAKSGTMSGVYCLSGYLVARSGKVLIFSMMHNNFVGSSGDWKLEMVKVFERIRNFK